MFSSRRSTYPRPTFFRSLTIAFLVWIQLIGLRAAGPSGGIISYSPPSDNGAFDHVTMGVATSYQLAVSAPSQFTGPAFSPTFQVQATGSTPAVLDPLDLTFGVFVTHDDVNYPTESQTFNGGVQTIHYVVTGKFPIVVGADSLTYSYTIFTRGFPTTVADPGHSISATTFQPPSDSASPQVGIVVKENATSAANTTFTYTPSALPASLRLEVAGTSSNGNTIIALSATVDANAALLSYGSPATNVIGVGTVPLINTGPNTTRDYEISAIATDSHSKTATASQTITVNITEDPPAIQGLLTWGPISDITLGTALSGTQLNAVATYNGVTVPGTYAYTPAAGTQPPLGTQLLNVTFTPTSSLYAPVSGTNTVTVIAAPPPPSCGLAIVNHAAVINGLAGVRGSLQILTGEDMQLNGNAFISDTLYLPGSPTLRLNGNPIIGTNTAGSGSTTPSKYTLTLNGNAVIGHLITRTNPVALTPVAPPPATTGTRDISLNKASDSAGNWATVRDIKINGSIGDVAVPGGTYRDITVNGKNTLVLGAPNVTTVYNFRNFTVNGTNGVKVLGPVIITVNSDVKCNGIWGNSAHPEWVSLRLATGSLTLNGKAELYAFLRAPAGTVRLDGVDLLKGGLESDKLVLNGQGVVDICNR